MANRSKMWAICSWWKLNIFKLCKYLHYLKRSLQINIISIYKINTKKLSLTIKSYKEQLLKYSTIINEKQRKCLVSMKENMVY